MPPAVATVGRGACAPALSHGLMEFPLHLSNMELLAKKRFLFHYINKCARRSYCSPIFLSAATMSTAVYPLLTGDDHVHTRRKILSVLHCSVLRLRNYTNLIFPSYTRAVSSSKLLNTSLLLFVIDVSIALGQLEMDSTKNFHDSAYIHVLVMLVLTSLMIQTPPPTGLGGGFNALFYTAPAFMTTRAQEQHSLHVLFSACSVPLSASTCPTFFCSRPSPHAYAKKRSNPDAAQLASKISSPASSLYTSVALNLLSRLSDSILTISLSAGPNTPLRLCCEMRAKRKRTSTSLDSSGDEPIKACLMLSA